MRSAEQDCIQMCLSSLDLEKAQQKPLEDENTQVYFPDGEVRTWSIRSLPVSIGPSISSHSYSCASSNGSIRRLQIRPSLDIAQMYSKETEKEINFFVELIDCQESE